MKFIVSCEVNVSEYSHDPNDPDLYDDFLEQTVEEVDVDPTIERTLLDPRRILRCEVATCVDNAGVRHGIDAQVEIPALELFIFPEGAKVKTSCPPPRVHSFVLTDDNGDKLYGFCYSYWHPLGADVLTIVHSQLAARAAYVSRTKRKICSLKLPTEVFSPRSLCLISPYPFHKSFHRFLKRFYSIHQSSIHSVDSPLPPLPPMDVMLHEMYRALNSYKVLQMHLPSDAFDTTGPQGTNNARQSKKAGASNHTQTTLIESLRVDINFWAASPCSSTAGSWIQPGVEAFWFPGLRQPLAAPPLCDVDFRSLLRLISTSNLVNLITAILWETSVLFISRRIPVLAPALDALMCLIYPFKWPFAYVPILPTVLKEYLQLPHPFIYGSLPEVATHIPEHVMLVDLDNDIITGPTSAGPSSLHPKPFLHPALLRRLKYSIMRFADAQHIPKVPMSVAKFQEIRRRVSAVSLTAHYNPETRTANLSYLRTSRSHSLYVLVL